MKTVRRVDVAIVGAGPAGSSCAIVLTQAGLSVVLIDKARFPRPKICGNCLNPGIWSLLDLLGARDEFRSMHPETLESFSVMAADGRVIMLPVDSNSSEPFVACSRREFDNLLVKRAMRCGAELLEEERLLGVTWNGKWTLSCEKNDISARFLVGADGRNSRVAFLLQAEQSPKSRSSNRVGIQWICRRVEQVGKSVHMVLFKNGYGGIVNLRGQFATVALVTNRETALLLRKDFRLFLKNTIGLNANGVSLIKHLDPIEGITTASPIDPVRRSIDHPAAFLIGDARTTVEPFTGEGVLFALQDGIATGARVAADLHKSIESLPLHPEKDMLINRISSPVLRRPRLAGALVAVGSHMPHLAALIGRRVLRQPSF